jgi:hypothetical protein
LATWDNAPVLGTPGNDFDPQFDLTLTCSGCWRADTNVTTGTSYARNTVHTTQGAGSLQMTFIGKGAGGEYSVPINGSQFQLDTHFDDPMEGLYSNNPAANGGVVDPRYTALYNAILGVNPGSFYTIDFDIIYDVQAMRSIAWMAPEETVNPGPNDENRYPQRYFWIGMRGFMTQDADGNGFAQVLTDASGAPGDPNNINPFDAQWDSTPFPVFNASFALDDFEWEINPATPPTSVAFQLVYNSTSGTLPASSNTTPVTFWIDNLRLVEHDPTDECDFNNSDTCTLDDFALFMAQHLVATPTLGDYDTDGDNDFEDFQQFEFFYDQANLGSGGSLRSDLAGGTVPEPSSLLLVGLALAGIAALRTRPHRATMVLLVGVAATFCGQAPAQAQLVELVESFETIGKWVDNPGAVAQANPSVALSTIGATQGSNSLKVTQAEDTTGDNNFVWVATTSPNWTDGDTAFEVLANAVNIGAQHFNLLLDVHFRAEDLGDQVQWRGRRVVQRACAANEPRHDDDSTVSLRLARCGGPGGNKLFGTNRFYGRRRARSVQRLRRQYPLTTNLHTGPADA